MSVTVKTRIPPTPPPKPKNYYIQNTITGSHNVPINPCRPINDQTKKLGVPQGDSDTDSGICADSDNQLSPGRNHYPEQEFCSTEHNCNIFQTDFDLKYGKTSTASIPKREAYRNGIANEVQIVRQRRLPQRPVLNGNSNSSCRINRATKHFRVRFADQVSPPSSTLSYSSENQDCRTISSCSNNCNDCLPTNVENFEKNFAEQRRYLFEPNCNEPFNIMPVEDADMFPLPPSYASYFGAVREAENGRYSRQKTPCRVVRHYQSRSSSLPRGNYTSNSETNRWICTDFTKQPISIEFNIEQPDSLNGTVVRNIPSQFVNETAGNARPSGGRMLPDAPLDINSRGRVRQPAYSRQRRVKQAQAEHRSHSVGPSNWEDCEEQTEKMSFYSHRDRVPSVQAKLIALDHRGFRTVLIEKVKPGPFGFYIATGIINQRRGIFISRVSLSSLMPVLSVGDELIYVENELIKGRTLEYVQSLIAGKNVVTVVLLPNISSALC